MKNCAPTREILLAHGGTGKIARNGDTRGQIKRFKDYGTESKRKVTPELYIALAQDSNKENSKEIIKYLAMSE